MSISLNANFELLSAGLYLDARQQFNTIIEMKDFAETSIPDGFITYNKETQKHYVFNSSNTIDATLGKWREYNSGDSSSTYPTWDSNVDYKVGNVVLKDEVRYSCIADHTSTDFETDSINWVVVLEQYYHVTQEQYNKMVSDGLITDSTKDLYIIDGNSEGGNSFSASYTTLDELGLTADATFQDVVDALPKGGSALLGVTEFTNYQIIFPYEDGNDQFARVHIVKGTADGSRMYARWFRKDGVKEAIAKFNINNNLFDGWQIQRLQQTYTSLSQLKLTADATIDDVIGALKDGETAIITTNEFTDYLTMFPNYCTNDQYAILKVEKKNSNRCFIEWRQKDGNAYAIGGLKPNNTFSDWSNFVRFKKDGFADDSIISIGETVSGDGTIQTLASLGFSNDILTWENGIYKVSHVSGLINLPSDITNASPGFRLEHHNIKKWNANHNPSYQTWGQRHSVIYCDNGDIYTRFYESGATASVYINDTGWRKIATDDKSKATLVTNTSTLKLDATKKNASWYGAIKLTYLYNTSPVEVEITFRSTADDLRWAVINGQKYINTITFTQDGSNTAHYTIGIQFAGTTYGCYQAEVIGDFADINSLTSEAFTGAKTAVYSSPYGKNNGVSLVSAPEDIGLTYPCTTVQLAQAMRNKFNITINAGAIGVFNCGGESYKISDAPTDYGLLHIETFGHDRIMIRFDGIGGSTYAGSWIGQIKGSGGTFSSITWLRIDYNTYSTTEQVIGTWIDGKTIYRKVIQYTFVSNATGIETTTTIGSVPGLDTLIKAEATIKRLDIKYDYHVPYGKNAQNHGYIVANTSSGSAGSIILYDSAHSVNDIIYAIIEYTKR